MGGRIDAFVSNISDLHDTGPRFKITMNADYLGVSGSARAREYAPGERFYASADMKDLDVVDNMGAGSMVLYNLGMDLRVGYRNHLAVNYLWGEAGGEGTIKEQTGFNDRDYIPAGETEGMITLDSLRLEWYYRTIDTVGAGGEYTVDLGLGAMNLRSYISVGEGDESTLETEAISAPLMPYFMGRAEWRRPRKKTTFGIEARASFYNVDSTDIEELPATGRYLKAEVYGKRPLNDTMTMTAGVSYWRVDLSFDGIETNHRNHHADNELDITMVGAYVGITFDDPQAAVVAALRSLLR